MVMNTVVSVLPPGNSRAQSSAAQPAPAAVQDSGLACLVMLSQFHAVAADPEKLRHEFSRDGQAMDVVDILNAAKSLGLVAARRQPSRARLALAALPAIAAAKDGGFFILARVDQDKALVQEPGASGPQVLELAALFERWSGELIQITSRASLAGEMAKFDFSWFLPAVVKYRRPLVEVLLVSFVLQFFMLVTPLFFQVVMDKVLVHNGLTTLHVVCIGLLVISVFDVVLTGLRSYVFAHTSSRIDVELGARLFRHLLGLPMAYFTARRVGDSVARIRELETIRSFLTGNAITVVLDLLFSVVFLAVMLYYSVWLTLVVVVSLPCYALLSVLFTPVLRARLNEKFNRGAENQAFLVETIGGIDTVKSMAVQPQWAQKWDNQLAAYVAAGFRTTTIGTLANNGVSLVSKLVTVATIWLGAQLVVEGKLSVGQLIAFNMLAGYVAAPVIRLAQLWTEFQQVGISMQRLGDILNTRPEIAGNKSAMPRIEGHIEFDAVSFRYRPDAPQVLRGISFDVAAGEVVGIVGRSGSGKSTLTKLVQRMYIPDQGRVLIDGVDLATTDATTVRRQLGVVLQENMLFNRSIRDNIALVNTGMSLEAVIAAAKLAGAHEFIIELPEAYDTLVGEHGATLSGGQRQRIAIARALIGNPRILIFDEATSALDYESERILKDNMKSICAGRTVLIIAHRLSTVRDANRIVVVDKGQIVEQGTHEELLGLPGGQYAHLHAMQGA
ncbi:type I secretion system ABC transporter, HlyB family [Polaromonas sp. CF318]|uniref:type I secretion system permease/ATPase n=1 Tax=Polaromonas sp. CF318 TaxID=1144318 RepID=UPI000270EA35|nr:type I secretion system ABC transporter, HlyB family [Polaromonas sp. CF318]